MKYVVRVLLLIVLALPLSVFAQSEDDITIDDIENAFAALYKNDSIRMEGETIVDQTITFSGSVIEQTIVQDITGEMQFEDTQLIGLTSQLNQTLTANSMGTTTEGSMLMEMIYVDEILYMKVSETTGALVGIYPDGWINLTEDGDSVEALALLNLDNLLNTFNKPLLYPLDDTTVNSFKSVEVDPELKLPEGTMAYALDINAEAAFNSADMASLFSGFEQLGIDMEDLLAQMAQGAGFDVTVYLLDEQVIRIEAIMTIDAEITVSGLALQLVQSSSSIVSYTDFNFPLEITAPEEE
ncbi:MAG: hypothetical protein SFZ02_19985 [bacterium]|nr:hypothetical protein [bacterium]